MCAENVSQAVCRSYPPRSHLQRLSGEKRHPSSVVVRDHLHLNHAVFSLHRVDAQEDIAAAQIAAHRGAAGHAAAALALEDLHGRAALRASALDQVGLNVPREDRPGDQRKER